MRRVEREALVTSEDWDKAWISESKSENAALSPDSFFREVMRTAQRMVQGPMEKIIEIGAGGGTFVSWLSDLFTNVQIIGLDYSLVGLKLVKSKVDLHKAAAVSLVAGRLEDLPFVQNSFDLVASFGLIEHYVGPSRLSCIHAHCNLVRRGGVIVIMTPNRRSLLYRSWYGLAHIISRISPSLAELLSINILPEKALDADELILLANQAGLDHYEVLASNAYADFWQMIVQRLTTMRYKGRFPSTSKKFGRISGRTLALVGSYL